MNTVGDLTAKNLAESAIILIDGRVGRLLTLQHRSPVAVDIVWEDQTFGSTRWNNCPLDTPCVVAPDAFEVDAVADAVFGEVTFATPGKKFILTNMHSPLDCAGRACVVHNPSDHHMSNWPLLWRADRGIMERLCPHGVGIPDPDDVAYRRDILGDPTAGTHGVCGECAGG